MPVYATGRVEQFITDPITGDITIAPGVKGVTLNTVNMSITEYLDYPFNSFAMLNGKMLGANINGLYILEGDDDDSTAISAVLRTVLHDFGDSVLKRLRACYVGIKFAGGMIAKPVGEDEIAGPSSALGSLSSGYKIRRAKFGRGPKSTYWGVEISNKDGEDFTIDTIELEQMSTARRIG